MIKFEGVTKTKSLGKLNGDGIGVSIMTNAEVTSAEYVKDSEGKLKQSAKGNKQVKLNVKVTEEITKTDGGKATVPHFMNVTYYATDYSPALKDITPTDKLKKFVQIKYNTGGLVPEGKDNVFGNFKIRNYIGLDGSPKNSTSTFGCNVSQAIKKEGLYIIKDFDGNDVEFITDSRYNVSVKGFVDNISNTESFITENYNEKSKLLKFDIYYMENASENSDYDTTMPCVLEGIEKGRVMDFIKFIKNSTNNVLSVKGSVKSYPIYGESKDTGGNDFGEYSFGGVDVIGYEARLLIDFDSEKNNWVISKTKNEGKLIKGGFINSNSITVVEDEFPF